MLQQDFKKETIGYPNDFKYVSKVYKVSLSSSTNNMYLLLLLF